MGFSKLANMRRRIPEGGRSNPRLSRISGVGIHHNAGVDAYGEATNPRRQVSANYWITNAGTIIPNIDENRRAWTSGMLGYPAGANADHRNITVEVSNSPEGVRTGSWAISAAALEALTKLIADVYKRHGLGKVKRGSRKGVGVHRDWVPTACPGPYIMKKLPSIIKAANELNNPKPKPKPVWKEHTMRVIFNTQDKNNETRRAVVGELTFHLQGPTASSRERVIWGKVQNVTQDEWDTALDMVNARRGMVGLKPLKGVRGETNPS